MTLTLGMEKRMKGWPGEPQMEYDVLMADGNAAANAGRQITDVIFDFGNVLIYWDPAAVMTPRYSDGLVEQFLDYDVSGFYDINNELDQNDPTWKIYTEDIPALPQYIGPDAKINRAFITQGCIVEGEVKNSVLFTGAKVGKGAKVIDCVLMPGVEVEENAVVQRALVAEDIHIGSGAYVGSADSEHIDLVSKRVKGVEYNG